MRRWPLNPFLYSISSMTSSGCSVYGFSRSYNSMALLTASSETFVFIAFLVRARSWCFSFTSFMIVSDVVLGGIVAWEDGSDDLALTDINRLEGALMEV